MIDLGNGNPAEFQELPLVRRARANCVAIQDHANRQICLCGVIHVRSVTARHRCRLTERVGMQEKHRLFEHGMRIAAMECRIAGTI